MTLKADFPKIPRHAIGVLHNMSVPPRTVVAMEVKPVFGTVSFCLRQCLRLNGFIDVEQACAATDFQGLGEAAEALAGRRSLEQFWRHLGEKGFSPESADVRAREIGGACIGRCDEIYPQRAGEPYHVPHTRICTDLSLCLAVLSRRVSNLFLSYRPADYSFEQLFNYAFVVDDPRFVAHSIPLEQWPLREGAGGPPRKPRGRRNAPARKVRTL